LIKRASNIACDRSSRTWGFHHVSATGAVIA
jgi:hypothetical protein